MIVAQTRLTVLTSIKEIMSSIPSYETEARVLGKDFLGVSLSDFQWKQYAFERTIHENVVKWITEIQADNPDLEGCSSGSTVCDYSLPEALEHARGNKVSLDFDVRIEVPQGERWYTAYVSKASIYPQDARVTKESHDC